MQQNIQTSVIVASATTFTALLVVGLMIWRQKRKAYHSLPLEDIEIPTKWTKIGEVKELVFYPLKGAKRKYLSQAMCTKVGIKEVQQNDTPKLDLIDREFVLYNDKHEFLSIKKNTKILFVETEAVDMFRVRFSFPDAEDLIVTIPDSSSTMDHIEIYFGETVKTVDCGDEAAAWFSQNLLNKPTGLRLGCFVSSLIPARSINGCYENHAKAYTKFHSDYMGTFHNLASYLLVNEASVADLNSRISRPPVTEHYFRPNIVVKGPFAFSEDKWDWIRIGENVVLRGFKYCVRCTITTVDPDTGIRDPKIEPLKTLRTYRQVKEAHLKKVDGTDPVMGLYAGCHKDGIIRAGDPVYINAE